MLPEASKRSYVSVVQSLVAFSKSYDEPRKPRERPWFSTGVKSSQSAPNSQQPILGDGRPQDRVAKYKDTFDPRVTAR